MPYVLPPFAEPRIALSRTPSPVHETSHLSDHTDAPISGVELIVSKLPHDTVSSAANHLRAILGEHHERHPTNPLVPVCVTPGDERSPVDYVFVSVDPTITQDPRPDLLDQVRATFSSLYQLHADWKVGKGPDRTRRIYFQVDSFTQAEAFLPKLRNYLEERGCSFQCSFISKVMSHIIFDLLDRASVENLFKNPPVIEHQTLYPSTPRYIQPVYPLEVAIIGVKDVFRPTSVIDQYIQNKYGNVIASSRLALNGDAYCVVFNNWAQTSRFLSDRFDAFSSGFGVSHSVSQLTPALLYVLNSNGLPLSPRASDSSNSPVHQLQAQLDVLQQKFDNRARALNALAAQQELMSQQLQDDAQTTTASFAALSSAMTGSARLQAAIFRLDMLQSDVRSTRFILTISPPEHRDALSRQLQTLLSDVATQRDAVTQAQQSLTAANHIFPTIAFHPMSPLPVPSPPAASTASTPPTASTSQHLGTRTLADLHEDTEADGRRQCARSDAGPSDDSPIHVDPDI